MRFPSKKILVFFLFSTLGVQAFAEQHWRVVVPFQFEANGRSFPAGAYDIAMDIDHGLVTLSNDQNPAKRLQWLAIPADGGSHAASLKFGGNGVHFTLITLNAGKWATPRHGDSSKYPIVASIYDNDHKDLMASVHE